MSTALRKRVTDGHGGQRVPLVQPDLLQEPWSKPGLASFSWSLFFQIASTDPCSPGAGRRMSPFVLQEFLIFVSFGCLFQKIQSVLARSESRRSDLIAKECHLSSDLGFPLHLCVTRANWAPHSTRQTGAQRDSQARSGVPGRSAVMAWGPWLFSPGKLSCSM